MRFGALSCCRALHPFQACIPAPACLRNGLRIQALESCPLPVADLRLAPRIERSSRCYTRKTPHQQQSVLIHDAVGRPWTKIVAALVAAAFLGPRPSPQHCVNYKDGDRDNYAVDNLFWGPRPKLPILRQERSLAAEDVLAIRRRDNGCSGELGTLAQAFGTTPQNIQLIVSGRRWAHLPMQ